ncbi:cobalt/nickel transport system permease protein [Cohaesibacter sp. ES.047]|uniref:cobalt ECF transporter T component CbiQ n=1 Tax=Cohaesibacter sp. ES.047 TaxID=1798205 RepID=UPI000BBFB156|nr:cobalt ECF transporter T component CbiQ [Cohaesibacter sp. ES.047]SNY93550.1 cobalt/nickel transport system permease protein [Cohaesibacter sp. ES.047]
MTDVLERAGRAHNTNISKGGVDRTSRMWLRELDPRVRIVAVVTMAICVVQLSSLPVLALALSFSIILMHQARLPFWSTLKRVAMMDSFIIFLIVMLPFTTPGVAMFTVWGFPASYEGLYAAVIILLKANSIVMATLALIGTLEAVTLGHALSRLKVPDRLVHLLLFTVRYIDVLHAEYQRLRTAMKCRGFAPGNNLHTYRTVGYLVGMLLIRSLERSERIMKAMKCRGFHGQFHLLDNMQFSRLDVVFASFACLALLTLLTLEVVYGVAA